MKRPITKIYQVFFNAQTEKNETDFEKELDKWRLERNLIISWQKSMPLKHKFGDEE